MLGFTECCDAMTYRELGQGCRDAPLLSCWHADRPMGSILLNAAMYPWGFAPLSHLALAAFSVFVVHFHASSRGAIAAPHGPSSPWQLARRYAPQALGAFLLLEAMFAGLASVNLTDVPAGVLAAVAILAFVRRDGLLFAIAAAASVLIRAAYLYPMVLLAFYFLAESLYARRWERAAMVGIFFLCIAPQFWATSLVVGRFSFLSPSQVDFWMDFHLARNWAGYDTLLLPTVHGHPWPSGASLPLSAAFERQDWGEAARLVADRLRFYFGSFVPLGKAYLDSPGERIFSMAVLAVHAVLALLALRYMKARFGVRGLALAVPLLLILGQSVVIIPEQRFVFVIQLLLLTLSYLYLLSMARVQWR